MWLLVAACTVMADFHPPPPTGGAEQWWNWAQTFSFHPYSHSMDLWRLDDALHGFLFHPLQWLLVFLCPDSSDPTGRRASPLQSIRLHGPSDWVQWCFLENILLNEPSKMGWIGWFSFLPLTPALPTFVAPSVNSLCVEGHAGPRPPALSASFSCPICLGQHLLVPFAK